MPSEPENNLVDRREIAEQLLTYGIDPNRVAAVTRLPIRTVNGLSMVRETTTHSGGQGNR
jgi:hypothetical protein